MNNEKQTLSKKIDEFQIEMEEYKNEKIKTEDKLNQEIQHLTELNKSIYSEKENLTEKIDVIFLNVEEKYNTEKNYIENKLHNQIEVLVAKNLNLNEEH